VLPAKPASAQLRMPTSEARETDMMICNPSYPEQRRIIIPPIERATICSAVAKTQNAFKGASQLDGD